MELAHDLVAHRFRVVGDQVEKQGSALLFIYDIYSKFQSRFTACQGLPIDLSTIFVTLKNEVSTSWQKSLPFLNKCIYLGISTIRSIHKSKTHINAIQNVNILGSKRLRVK